MIKSELIALLAQRHPHLSPIDVELATRHLLDQLGGALALGKRIEVRGFGVFTLHYRPPRMSRNPRNGAPVALPPRHVPHFKPAKQLRERVNTRLG